MSGPKTDLEAIRLNWEAYKQAVATVKYGEVARLREVNATLGYNISKSIPALLEAVEGSEKATAHHLAIRASAEKESDGHKNQLTASESKVRLLISAVKACLEIIPVVDEDNNNRAVRSVALEAIAKSKV